MGERCETCRFVSFIHNGRGLVFAYCRRYPASEEVSPDHWCGEWQAKAQEPAKRPSRVEILPGQNNSWQEWETTLSNPEPAKPKEREPGWYWVRRDRADDGGPVNPGYEWMPCECLGGCRWYLRRGLYSGWIDGDDFFDEIDERRIERQL